MKKENIDKIQALEQLYEESPPALVWDKIVEDIQDHEFTNLKKEPSSNKRGIVFIRRDFLAIAASILLLVFVSTFWLNMDKTPSSRMASNEMNTKKKVASNKTAVSITEPGIIDNGISTSTKQTDINSTQKSHKKSKAISVKAKEVIAQVEKTDIFQEETFPKPPSVAKIEAANSETIKKSFKVEEIEEYVIEKNIDLEKIEPLDINNKKEKLVEYIAQSAIQTIPVRNTIKSRFLDKAAKFKEVDTEEGAISMIVHGIGIIGKELGFKNKRPIKTIEIQF